MQNILVHAWKKGMWQLNFVKYLICTVSKQKCLSPETNLKHNLVFKRKLQSKI